VFLIGQLGLRRAQRKLGLALVTAAILALPAPGWVQAKESRHELSVVSRSQLPPEAQATEKLIHSGGPFRYAKDGATFGNRERALPLHPRGYYREYTVQTPGSRDRGARRIVCGGSQPAQPDACFYTADHYASFKRIVQ
jgi:ribonuclease T1